MWTAPGAAERVVSLPVMMLRYPRPSMLFVLLLLIMCNVKITVHTGVEQMFEGLGPGFCTKRHELHALPEPFHIMRNSEDD